MPLLFFHDSTPQLEPPPDLQRTSTSVFFRYQLLRVRRCAPETRLGLGLGLGLG